MSEVGPIVLEADDSAVEETYREAVATLDRIETARQETEFNYRQAIRRTTRVMSGMLGISISAFGMMGGTLDPFQRALVGCVTSTISALQAVSMAMASNPITATFAVITAYASISLSVKTLWDVIHGVDRSKDEMREVQNILRMAHSSYILFKGAEM